MVGRMPEKLYAFEFIHITHARSVSPILKVSMLPDVIYLVHTAEA